MELKRKSFMEGESPKIRFSRLSGESENEEGRFEENRKSIALRTEWAHAALWGRKDSVCSMGRIVIYRPGSEAESRPKPDVRCRAGTGPNGRPNKAHGPGSGFGMRLPQAQA